MARNWIRSVGGVAATGLMLTLAACGDEGGSASSGDASSCNGGKKVVIGGNDFYESTLIAYLYGKALEAKGCSVEYKTKLGSRELTFQRINSGELTLMPEYNGNLCLHVDLKSEATSTEEVNKCLAEKLPATLAVLDSAAAEDKDAVCVTRATADKYSLETIGDLAPVAKDLTHGGPPEFKTRKAGAVGLKTVYGVEFKAFKSLDAGGPLTVTALKNGDIDAADLFTTDPAIKANDFVCLEDPKFVFPAQNVTPLIHKASIADDVRTVLNGISAKLDTETLMKLGVEVATEKKDADKVAENWLKSVGLV